MTPEKRQQVTLGVVLAVLAVVLWSQLGPSFDGGKSKRKRSRGSSTSSVLDDKRLVELQLAALDAVPGEFTADRNIFRFGPAPQRPKPPPPPPPPPRTQPVVRQTPPPSRPQEPQPPPVDVDLLGIFGPKRMPIAAFSDGDTVYIAREQETIKDTFIVDRIGLESVDLKFVGFPKAKAETLELGI